MILPVEFSDTQNLGILSGEGTASSGVNLIKYNNTILLSGFETEAYCVLTTEAMPDNSEVEVKLETPNTVSYTSDIAVWDDPSRIGTGSPAAQFQVTERNTERKTTYKIIFRMRPSVSEYDVFLEKV